MLFYNLSFIQIRICQSFVYDHRRHSCRLYAHDGNEPPAILHPANGYDFYVRTATSERCSGPGLPLQFSSAALMPTNPNLHTLRKTTTSGTGLTMYSVARIPTDTEKFISPLASSNRFAKYTSPHRPENYQFTYDDTVRDRDSPDATSNSNGLYANEYRNYNQKKVVANTVNTWKRPIEGTLSPTKMLAERTAGQNYIPSAVDVSSVNNLPLRPVTIPPSQSEFEKPVVIDDKIQKTSNDLLKITVPPKADFEKEVTIRDTLTTPLTPTFDNSSVFSKDVSTLSSSVTIEDTKNVDNRMVFWPTSDEQQTTAAAANTLEQQQQLTSYDITDPVITTTPSGRVRQHDSTCLTSTAYYVVIGNEIILPISSNEKDVRVLAGIEQSQCAHYCTANQGPKGENIKCSSMNYFPLEQKCEIYAILAEPHGPGSLVENEDVIYAEKFCLPTHSVICQEDEIFILYVQKKVVKNKLKVRTSNSITSCLRHCLEHRLCKAAVFDSTQRRCMLHDIDLQSSEAMEEAEPGWVLIENGCATQQQRASATQEKASKEDEVISYAETQWSEWSDCQFKLRGRMVRVRTRQCGADCPDGGMQVQKC